MIRRWGTTWTKADFGWDMDMIEPLTTSGGRNPVRMHLYEECSGVVAALKRDGEVLRTRGKPSELDSTIELCGWCIGRWLRD